MHWTDSRRGWVVYTADAHAIHTAWVRNPFVAFLVIFLLNNYFLFYFINKNNQCNVCKYKYYLTTHTHMSEVEVYSVNKLTFWAMDKNVVGKKISRAGPGRPGGIIMQGLARWLHAWQWRTWQCLVWPPTRGGALLWRHMHKVYCHITGIWECPMSSSLFNVIFSCFSKVLLFLSVTTINSSNLNATWLIYVLPKVKL